MDGEGVGDVPDVEGDVTAAVKCCREAESWDFEDALTRGRQRKWVSGRRGGRGGIPGGSGWRGG